MTTRFWHRGIAASRIARPSFLFTNPRLHLARTPSLC